MTCGGSGGKKKGCTLGRIHDLSLLSISIEAQLAGGKVALLSPPVV